MLSNKQIISQHPFFEGMSPAHLASLAAAVTIGDFAAGDYIFRQSQPAHTCYLLGSGRVAIETDTPAGEHMLVQIVGEGELLGLSWIFPPHLWQFDARVLQPVHALIFDADYLRSLFEADHELALALMQRYGCAVVHRLQALRKRYVEERIEALEDGGSEKSRHNHLNLI